MPAVEKFRTALQQHVGDPTIVASILSGYETISDRSTKEKRAAFFAAAVNRMDALLDPAVARAIRDACACSLGGWRLKAVQKMAHDTQGASLEEKVAALQLLTHMGKPVLNSDGSITAGIGPEQGCPCACPVFGGLQVEPVSKTYCYCCAGHFRFHYQIALGVTLTTREVRSSALASQGAQPCRFIYDIVKA